jgi:transposase InsO family protein
MDINTKEAAKLFFTHWYCRGYGLPKVIISDRDKLFVSHMWQDLMDLLEIKLVMSTARHQQTNGGSEHLVKMAKLCLKINCGRDSANWPNSIAATEFALNSSISSATGYTPLALAFGLCYRIL